MGLQTSQLRLMLRSRDARLYMERLDGSRQQLGLYGYKRRQYIHHGFVTKQIHVWAWASFFFWFPNLYMYTDTKKNISTSCKRQARGITTYITSSYCVLFGTYYKWCELLLVLACSCLMSLSLPSVSPHCIHKQSHRDHYLFSSLPLIPSYWNNRFDCYHFNYI